MKRKIPWPAGRGGFLPPVAVDLARHWLAAKAGENVRIDCTGDTTIRALASQSGLLELAPVTTMVRPGASGSRMVIPRPRQFAVASQAFG